MRTCLLQGLHDSGLSYLSWTPQLSCAGLYAQTCRCPWRDADCAAGHVTALSPHPAWVVRHRVHVLLQVLLTHARAGLTRKRVVALQPCGAVLLQRHAHHWVPGMPHHRVLSALTGQHVQAGLSHLQPLGIGAGALAAGHADDQRPAGLTCLQLYLQQHTR